MNRQHVVVFGDDGSEHSDRAWLWINSQHWQGWQLEVVTAHVPPPGPPVGEDKGSPHLWEPPSPRRTFAEARFSDVRFLRAEADPRVVLDQADAGLVVIGPKGVGGLKALHIGSTAEFLLHRPRSPLALVRSSAPVRRVLVAVDGSAHAQRAVEALAAMPWSQDVEDVEVLGVPTVGIYDDTAEIRAAVERAAGALATAGVKATGAEAEGHKAGTIVNHAQALGADLVVLGARGLRGVKRLLLGSTASAVVRAAPCTVLVASAAEEQPAEGDR